MHKGSENDRKIFNRVGMYGKEQSGVCEREGSTGDS